MVICVGDFFSGFLALVWGCITILQFPFEKIRVALLFIAWLVLYPVFEKMDERPKMMYLMFGGMTILGIAYLLFVTLYHFPADVDAENLVSGTKNAYTLLGATLGVLVAYHVDRTHTNFSTETPLPGQILKVVIGLALTLAVKAGAKPVLNLLLNGHQAANLIRYFLMVIGAGVLWPMTFKWFAKIGKK